MPELGHGDVFRRIADIGDLHNFRNRLVRQLRLYEYLERPEAAAERYLRLVGQRRSAQYEHAVLGKRRA
jgi:hypothetical protein